MFRLFLIILLFWCLRTCFGCDIIIFEVWSTLIFFLNSFTTSFCRHQIKTYIFILTETFGRSYWSEDVFRFDDLNFFLIWAFAFCTHAKDFLFDFCCDTLITWCRIISLYAKKVEIHLFSNFIPDFELFNKQSFAFKYRCAIKLDVTNLHQIKVPGTIILTSEVKQFCRRVNRVRTKKS